MVLQSTSKKIMAHVNMLQKKKNNNKKQQYWQVFFNDVIIYFVHLYNLGAL